MNRNQAIQGYREFADFLDTHPKVPLPNVMAGTHEYLIFRGDDTAMITEVDRIAAELGVTAGWQDDGRYAARRTFGISVTYEAAAFPRHVPVQAVAA